MDPRIIYLAAKNYEQPSGGVKQIFRCVERLAALGYNAMVGVSDAAKRPAWIEQSAPLLDLSQPVTVTPRDHVVLGELEGGHMRRLTNSRRHIYVQNHYYVYNALENAFDWSALGIRDVIASSSEIARYLERTFKLTDVPIIPYVIDAKLFAPASERRMQIAIMPRKRPLDATFLIGTFRRRHQHYADVPWVVLQNMSETRVAEELSRSAVFLSLSFREGFGIPPLEAMAAGCLVAGFTGGGGDSYATPENGLWAEDGDLEGCVDQVARALDICREQGTAYAERRKAGHATVAAHDQASMDRALKAYWDKALAATPQPAAVP